MQSPNDFTMGAVGVRITPCDVDTPRLSSGVPFQDGRGSFPRPSFCPKATDWVTSTNCQKPPDLISIGFCYESEYRCTP